MADILPYIYLGYMFVSIYFLSLFFILYIKNRERLFEVPKTKIKYRVSVLVPAYNESETIQSTIESIFSSEYPIEELIVLNDGSSDDTSKKVKGLFSKYKKLKLIDKPNSGKADSLNKGISVANGDLIAVVDADSYPAKDAFAKLVGFFDDPTVGVATPFIVPRNRTSFFERLQSIEYNVIAFTRKLLGFVEAIYVTPGPLAIYRKSALEKIGGFDKENMTEDIEATWHLTKEGYKRKMCLLALATTTVPAKVKPWFVQRRRWNLGGLQCISKYKKYFLQKGMLGFFILPFFVLQLFLGLLGLSIFFYLIITRTVTRYLYTVYSINIGTPIITVEDFLITPSFLNYLGVILFVLGGLFTILILFMMKDVILKKQNIFNILFYLFFYLTVYPFIMLNSLYHYFRGIRKWR